MKKITKSQALKPRDATRWLSGCVGAGATETAFIFTNNSFDITIQNNDFYYGNNAIWAESSQITVGGTATNQPKILLPLLMLIIIKPWMCV